MSEEQKDMGMDAVDEAQQGEIIRLQEQAKSFEDKNRQQDVALRMGKAIAILMAVLLLVFMLILANREISCPHPECPHHILESR